MRSKTIGALFRYCFTAYDIPNTGEDLLVRIIEDNQTILNPLEIKR